MDIEIIVVNSTSVENFTKLYEITYEKCPFFNIYSIDRPFKGIIIGYSIGSWIAENYNNKDYQEREIREYFDGLLVQIPKELDTKICYINYSTFADMPSYFAWVYSENKKEDFDADIHSAFNEIDIELKEDIFKYLEIEFYHLLR